MDDITQFPIERVTVDELNPAAALTRLFKLMVTLDGEAFWVSVAQVFDLLIDETLGGDADFADTLTATLATKLDKLQPMTDVAGAATVNLGAVNSAIVNVTGTGATITSLGTAAAGTWRVVRFAGANTLTNNAAIVLPTGANIATQANDQMLAVSLVSGNWRVLSYIPAITPAAVFPMITSSVAANALTIGLNPCSLTFRSATIADGSSAALTVSSALSLIVPSGATLGTVSGQTARLMILALNNAGTVELAVVNLAGGVNLDETGLISTTAMSSGATSASTIYSTNARTNVPYRVLGFLDVTEATAGTWATAAAKLQGAGGQSFGLAGIGQGQKHQSVSRSSGVTYFNTTGRPILLETYINTGGSNSGSASVTFADGTVVTYAATFSSGGGICTGSIIIPPGAYTPTFANASSITNIELR